MVGQLIVSFVEGTTEDRVKEIADNCGAKFIIMHENRALIEFENSTFDEMSDKFYAWGEFVENVNPNWSTWLV
jgi:hypothetical protein